jgi:hypothetical protein
MRDSPPRSYRISSEVTTEIIPSHGSFRFKSRAQPSDRLQPAHPCISFLENECCRHPDAPQPTAKERPRTQAAEPFGDTSYLRTTAHQDADTLDAREQLML